MTDDWIPWKGGIPPLPEGVPHEVKLRDGDTLCMDNASAWADYWQHDGNACDIIAYRVLE